ncbi:hypothetical protein LCGC14_2377410 [marine sediment metagenome]|uniref:Uncharacterized protein n=1 Tax=marine sediment metagenome TaxID=412755 RepID=A0A0F9CP94_9ZZZZ
MIPRVRWQQICEQAGRTVLTTELRRVEELEKFSNHQLVWAMQLYAKETVYPNLPDFEDWMKRETVPEELVCAAYLSEAPEIIKLADQLETLQGAWFPSPDTEMEIEEIKRRLGVALMEVT